MQPSTTGQRGRPALAASRLLPAAVVASSTHTTCSQAHTGPLGVTQQQLQLPSCRPSQLQRTFAATRSPAHSVTLSATGSSSSSSTPGGLDPPPLKAGQLVVYRKDQNRTILVLVTEPDGKKNWWVGRVTGPAWWPYLRWWVGTSPSNWAYCHLSAELLPPEC